MKNNCSKFLGVVTSGGASDEHPMSTRSASDGRRWHSRGMQLICTLVLLFTFAIGNVWGATTLFTTNFSTTDGWSNENLTTSGQTETTKIIKGTSITIHGYKSASAKVASATTTGGTFTFTSNNISPESSVTESNINYYMAIPVSGIVAGTVTVTITTSSGYKPYFIYRDGPTGSFSNRTQAAVNNTFTITGLTSTSATIYLGTSGKNMTSLTITTPELTDLSESAFYQLYATTSKTCAKLIEDAELPTYITTNTLTEVSSESGNSSSVSTPHDFTNLGTGTIYRLKTSNGSNIVLEGLSHVKSIRLYGNGNGSTRTVTVTATKISGAGTAPAISNISMPNSKKTVVEYSTGDLTEKSGYDINTYYTYTLSFNGACDIWGLYVEYAAPATYTLAWNLDGGSVDVAGTAAGSYTAGTTITAPTVSKSGYAFNGWDPAVPATMPAANSEYTATWTANTHSLVWNIPVDATITNPSAYTHGTVAYGTAIVPPTLTRPNYDFMGWDPALVSAMPDNDLTYTATWQEEAAKYNITYTNLKGSDVSAYPTKYSKGIGIASFASLADVEGFHFTGWSPASISTTDEGNIEIEAQWTPTYSVTYNLNGGTGTLPTETAKYATQEFTLAAQGDIVAPTNKQFLGWKDQDGNKYAAEANYTMPGKAVTLTAYWAAKVEDVIYLWEGAASGATEVGGTASSTRNAGTAYTNEEINANTKVHGGTVDYYCLCLSGKADYSDKFVKLALAQNIQAGDKVEVTAFYNKKDDSTGEDKTANARPQMHTMSGTVIFVDPNNLPNLNTSGSPAVRTFTVPSGINTDEVKMTRNQTGSNTWIAKLRIYRESYIDEDLLKTVTFNYNDGVTPNATIQLASGQTVAKPADPTWAHHRFNEWQLSGSTYNFSSPVTSNITLVANWTQLYTVTYAKGAEDATGDAPTQDELAAGEKFTVAANTFAYEGHDFSTWNDGSANYAPAAQYTMGSANVTLTAQWITATTKVTVTYKDGETTLGTEEVTINTGHPAEYADYQTRNLATFDGWYNDPDLAEGHKIADISALTASANVNVYGKWNYQYASSVNIEAWELENGAGKGATTKTSALISLLGTNKFASNLVWENGNIELDSLDDAKGDRNEPYLGLKVKSGGKMIDFRVANGQTVKVKFGAIKSTKPQVKINGVGSYADMTITDKVWSYTATGNDYISIKMADNNAVVFKQIMIGADPAIADVTLPWRVTYDANGGTCGTASAIWSGSALVLPNVTPAEPADYTFAGWYDEVSGGSLQGVAGASYTPTDNTTLHAHFAPVEYAINYNEGDHGQTAIVAASAGWGTEYTAIANPFTPETGYVFSGWAVTGVDGVSTIAAGGSFTMPKNAVTLTAQWEDVSKVAINVQTNVKYESLADAIAAAEAGQTIQLLQNIEQANGVEIAKNLTLDLNGKTFTCTEGSNVNYRAIKITAGDVTIQNGSIIAVPTVNFEGGCYGPIRIEGASTNVTLEDLTLQNGRHYGLGIKLVEGALTMEDCTVISQNGGGGLEVGEATADVINCTFTQTGLDNAHAWISTCLATCDNGVLNVQGGTYTSEHYSMYVYTSGGTMDVESGSFTGDVVNQVTPASYPDAVGTINISGGTFEGVGEEPINFTTDNTGKTTIAISGGTFDAPVENEYCAYGYVPAPADPVTGKYSVEPKEGVEIIGVVTTGGTNKTVTGLYKGDASVNLDNNKKIGDGKYIYVTLKEGYTFEETDVLVVDVHTKSDLTAEKALEITTGVGNIDGAVWKTLVDAEYNTGENSISLEGIAAGQTSIGLKRSAKQNAYINGLKVYRPMKPVLTAITINGRDGVIDEANKTVAVQIPYEANLAALTVVPTIVWNEAAATNSIVVNDGSAWIEGDNTYKLTDKDGDYTVYTITLTRDVLKHAVKFYDGETLLETLEVEDGTSIAVGDVPADPEKEDYIFQGWAETTDGAVVDVTSFTISATKNFYAKWVSDGAIKLIVDGTSGKELNTTNFLTGATLASSTVKVDNVDYAYVTLGGTAGSPSNIDAANKVIAYHATTTQTKVMIDVFNTSNNSRPIKIMGVIEGSSDVTELATIDWPNSGDPRHIKTQYYEFNNTANRTIYITGTNTVSSVDFLQVKVIESGEQLKKAGEAGYSLNMNQGRLVGQSGLTIDGANIDLTSWYKPTNSTVAKLKETSIHFTVVNPVLLKVTAANNKKYYVTKGSAGTDNPTEKTGVSEFDLTAGTWYITAGSSEVQLTNIAFELPKAATPVIETQPATNHTFDPGDMTATVVATVTEGTLHYQWYKKATVGDDEEVGTDAATLTTTTEGTYYVVVTNVLAGHQNTSVTSDEAELGYRVTNDATLMALSASAGTLDPTFDKDVINYTVNLAMGTTVVPTLTATATMNGYANVAKNEATEFVNYEAVSTVVVTSEDLSVTKTYTVHYYVDHLLDQVPVSATTIWDWTNAGENMKVTTSTSPVKKNEEAVMANVRVDDKQPTNDATFNSQALLFYGENVRAKDGGRYYASVGHIAFNATVPGIVEVEFSSNGDNTPRGVMINELKSDTSKMKASVKTYKAYVPAGDVVLMGYEGDETDKYIRISKITFTANPAVGYTRNVSNNIGTICVDHNVLPGGALGATFYQIASRNELYDYKIDFEEVLPNEELKAGEPYIFQSATGRIDLFFGETEAPAPVAVRGMIGNYEASTLEIDENNKNTILYIAQNKLWTCGNLVGKNLILNEHRAYIDMNQVPTYAEYIASQTNSAPGRRRVTLGRDAEQTATGIDAINASEKPMKIMIEGQIYILRGEKVFDATGRLVK